MMKVIPIERSKAFKAPLTVDDVKLLRALRLLTRTEAAKLIRELEQNRN